MKLLYLLVLCAIMSMKTVLSCGAAVSCEKNPGAMHACRSLDFLRNRFINNQKFLSTGPVKTGMEWWKTWWQKLTRPFSWDIWGKSNLKHGTNDEWNSTDFKGKLMKIITFLSVILQETTLSALKNTVSNSETEWNVLNPIGDIESVHLQSAITQYSNSKLEYSYLYLNFKLEYSNSYSNSIRICQYSNLQMDALHKQKS